MTGPAWWTAALGVVAAHLGVSSAPSRVLSSGARSTVALPNARLVVRIVAAGRAGDLERELTFVRAARAHDVPVLVPTLDDVIETEHGCATVWPLGQLPDQVSWSWLGAALRPLQAVPFDALRAAPVFAHIETDIAAYRCCASADPAPVEAAEARLNDLHHRVAGVEVEAAHGDAHPGNVVVLDGRPRLIDFELAGRAPIGWDASPAVVFHRRFGLAAHDLDALLHARGNGTPPPEPVVQLQELLSATYVMRRVAEGAAATGELAVRVRSLLDSTDRSRWHGVPAA